MIVASLRDPATVEGLRAVWRISPLPSLFLHGAIPVEVAAALRDRALPSLRERFIADRGRWRQLDLDGRGSLALAPIVELAARLVERPLALRSARLVAFVHGDYSLYKGDDGRAAEGERLVEVTADVSAATVGEGDLQYTDGGARFFQVPQLALSLALVERDAGIHRSERYVTHRAGDATIVRLRLTLA